MPDSKEFVAKAQAIANDQAVATGAKRSQIRIIMLEGRAAFDDAIRRKEHGLFRAAMPPFWKWLFFDNKIQRLKRERDSLRVELTRIRESILHRAEPNLVEEHPNEVDDSRTS